MKKHKNKIIAGIVIIITLTVAFFIGGGTENSPVNNTEVTDTPDTETETSTEEPSAEPTAAPSATVTVAPTKAPIAMATDKPTAKPVQSSNSEKTKKYEIAIDETKPTPVAPEESTVTDAELTCTLSVRCDTILNNLSLVDSSKSGLVPKNGIIFSEKKVSFYEGESVFNLLYREMKQNNIHFEFVNTPIYNSAYIEGIANIYEFDCGDLSGWMYKVNGWYPNYGCSQYQIKQGDKVEFVYTCDLGKDVGGEYSPRNGR